MTTRRFAPIALAGLLLATPALAAVPAVPTLPPSALHPGQKALVRTVFAGDSVETFEAEIVGVMAGGRADGEIIIARATSPRVIESGVAAGMSGSPVYVDGRLVGALALGWPFSKEPIFGITPIGEMLGVLDQPESAHVDGTAGPVGTDPDAAGQRYRGLSWTDDTLAAPAPPAAATGLPRALPLPMAAGGLAPAGLELARGAFASAGFLLTPGGRASSTHTPRAEDLEPGSAVAVDVLRGDLNFSAIGTVTYRDRDRVLIFGHPFFQAGEVRLPLSSAHIVGILPSLYDSFKFGLPGRPVGTVTQDRRPGVGGRLGASPALMPFGITVHLPGRTVQRFRFESVDDRSLLPQLVSTAAMSCVLESGGTGLQQNVRWTLHAYGGGADFALADRTAGDAPLAEVLTAIGSPLRFLANNTYARWHPDSLAIDLEVAPGRAQWLVRGASLQAAAVRPGGVARVRVELERWRGERRTIDVAVPVPAELPAGHYALWLGGGSDLDRAEAIRLPGRFRPTSLPDAVRRFTALRRSDELHAALWARSPEVTRDGEDYPELPVSTLAVLAPQLSAGERTRRGDWALLSESAQGVDGVLRGEITLDLNVDDRAP